MKFFENIVNTITYAFGLKSYFSHQAKAELHLDNAERLVECLNALTKNSKLARDAFYSNEIESLNSKFQWHKENLNDTYFIVHNINQFNLPTDRVQLDEHQLANVLMTNARTLRFENRKERTLSYIMPLASIFLIPVELYIAILKDVPLLLPKLFLKCIDLIFSLFESRYQSELRRKNDNDMINKWYEIVNPILDFPIMLIKHITIIIPINLIFSAARKITDYCAPHKQFVVKDIPPADSNHTDQSSLDNLNHIMSHNPTSLITNAHNAQRSDEVIVIKNEVNISKQYPSPKQ